MAGMIFLADMQYLFRHSVDCLKALVKYTGSRPCWMSGMRCAVVCAIVLCGFKCCISVCSAKEEYLKLGQFFISPQHRICCIIQTLNVSICGREAPLFLTLHTIRINTGLQWMCKSCYSFVNG